MSTGSGNNSPSETDLTLRAARGMRDLLADPERWCKRAAALDSGGGMAIPESPRACRWCLVGAMWKVIHDLKSGAYFKLRQALLSRLPAGIQALGEFNDNPMTTHRDVLSLLDRVIRELEETCRTA